MAYDEKEQERQVRDRKKQLAVVEADINDAIVALLATVKGRRFVWWLLEIGKVNSLPYARDPYDTAFQCGELNVGQQILARLVTVDPQGYLNMQKEHADEASQLAAVNNRDEPLEDDA